MTDEVTPAEEAGQRPPLSIDVGETEISSEEPKPVEEEGQTPENQEEKPQEGNKPEEPEKPKDEPFPKKAVNAISRRDKKIGKLQAEKAALERQLAQSRQPAGDAGDDPEPKESDFETYGEYLRAEARWNARQEFRSQQEKDNNARSKSTEDEIKNKNDEIEREQAQAINDNYADASKAFSDFKETIEQHATERLPDGRTVIPLSPAARSALLESDNGAYALYSILKENALEDLNSLSPYRAAMMVARHEDKAVSLSKPNKVSSAPQPPEHTAKGTAPASKDPSMMTDKEFAAWRRKQIAARSS